MVLCVWLFQLYMLTHSSFVDLYLHLLHALISMKKWWKFFTFAKLKKPFLRTAIDQVHEQNNKLFMALGGTKNLLNKKLLLTKFSLDRRHVVHSGTHLPYEPAFFKFLILLWSTHAPLIESPSYVTQDKYVFQFVPFDPNKKIERAWNLSYQV